MVKIEGRIPEMVFEINGKPEVVQFFGARVSEFWRRAREAFGWTETPIAEIAKRMQAIHDAAEKGEPVEVKLDEDKVFAAVDSILPLGLKGALRYQQYKSAFNEALKPVVNTRLLGCSTEGVTLI